MVVPSSLDQSHGEAHHRDDIQGLRAIAVLMVLAFHGGLPVPGGFVGVDVFFAISGFVITAMLLRELHASNRVRLSHFYVRRVRRLLPALALVVAVTAAGGAWLSSPLGEQQRLALTGVAASFFMANVEIYRTTGDYFDIPAEANPLLHLWTLSVEEQFYLLLPLTLVVSWQIGHRVRRPLLTVFAVIAAISLVSFALSAILTHGLVTLPAWAPQRVDQIAFYSPITRAWEFGAGALVAAASASLPRGAAQGHPVWQELSTVGLAAIVASAVVLDRSSPIPGVSVALPVLGACLVLIGGLFGRGLGGRVLEIRALVFIGAISYSLYLWHWPLIVFARHLASAVWAPPLAALLSAVPATLSFWIVERPIRAGVRGRTWVVAATGIAAPAILYLMLAAGSRTGWGSPELLQVMQDRDQPLSGYRARCTPVSRYSTVLDCGGPDAGTSSVLLVGDSLAEAAASRVIDTARGMRLRAFASTRVTCPVIPPSYTSTACGERMSDVMRFIDEQRPSVVLIMQNSPGTLTSEGKQDRLKWAPAYLPGTAGTWELALQELLGRLNASGTAVVIGAAPPKHERDLRECSHGWTVDFDCGNTPRAWVDAWRAEATAAERAIAARSTHVVYWDPIDLFCDRSICNQSRDGRVLYRDGTHVNERGAALMAPQLEKALGAALAAAQR